ncbi:MAG TPA: nuclear transport factor 2 family protein [Saprospiraceae bacterium]|nr:nuclear transport factor 2 family protein [Saprospiraceae bacterium]HMQ84142.1 nuclear transport factor 2 family protein [Saprospiraceae bacterium]
MKKTFTYLLLLWLIPMLLSAQEDQNTELYRILYQYDSLIFNLGFNQCDVSQMERLISEKAAFFHDQQGLLPSKADFIKSIREGLCTMENRPRRELVPESLEVFPLKNRGELYGAIQMGEHKFFLRPDGKEEIMTSVAKFTHLWLLEAGEWRLTQIYSFDHQAPK